MAELVFAHSAIAQMKAWVVIDTPAGQMERSGNSSGMVGLQAFSCMPIVWQFVGTIAVLRRVGSLQTLAVQGFLIGKKEVG